MFGPKREVTGGWRKLHNKEPRRIGWTGHIAGMGTSGTNIGIYWDSQKERDHWEDPDVGGRIILKWILEK
jgi:hypothetical protein